MIMKKLLLSTIILSAAINFSHSQSLTLVLPDTSAVSGDTLMLAFRVKDFERIVSMDFSIAWNPQVLQYLAFSKADLSNIAIGSSAANTGILRFSWFDLNGTGQHLPDGSTLFVLQFKAIGAPGNSSAIQIQDEPLPIEIVQALTNEANFHEPIGLQAAPGMVRILKSLNVGWSVRPVSCYGANDGRIELQIPTELSTASLSWKGPDSFSASEALLTGLSAGDYTFELRTADGELMYRGNIILTQPESAPEIMDITMDEMGCEDKATAVQWSVRGGLPPYQFQVGEKSMNDTFIVAMESGSYTLQVSDANNCISRKTFEIEAPKIPVFDLGSEQALCDGKDLVLGPGAGFQRYEWSTGASEPEITVTETGTYSLKVFNDAGCSYSDTVEVVASQKPELLVRNPLVEICPGDDVILSVSGASDYEWIDTSATLDRTQSAEVLASPLFSSLYRVAGQNACGTDTAEVLVNFFPVLTDAGPDSIILEGTSINLYASGAISYFWLPTDFPVSEPSIANPVVQPLESTQYKVILTDENGCTRTDSVFVEVLSKDIDLPRISLITPNGDGKNDVLFFPKAEKYGNNVLRVFNRWGDIVYQKLNYQHDEERFDGTYQGKALPDGNYYYVLAFRQKMIRQTLTILRD